MSGVHGNHGHHGFRGNSHHAHGTHGSHGAHGKRGSGEHRKPGAQGDQGAAPAQQPVAAPASAPAAQVQKPTMDTAMAALDAAIGNLAANFHKDSFNGQAAPASVAPTTSTLTNSVGDRNSDLFLNSTPLAHAAGAPAQVPQAAPAPVATPTLSLNDPLLDLKGGGGMPGGVLGDRSFLTKTGGGGMPGGVLGDRSKL
ncbi:MAG TPA: hypothetical protein VIG99_05450 [Myxococcaceae bacterium]|jgi:hypothetical protein